KPAVLRAKEHATLAARSLCRRPASVTERPSDLTRGGQFRFSGCARLDFPLNRLFRCLDGRATRRAIHVTVLPAVELAATLALTNSLLLANMADHWAPICPEHHGHDTSAFSTRAKLRGQTSEFTCPARSGRLWVTKNLWAGRVRCNDWF